jgi:glutamyl-Q tRNA(Asp) synthetase
VVGRFAPSPTGPLHAGSLATAMASWLDVRARDGRWIVRIEDLDAPREVDGAAQEIVETLEAYGFRWDGPIVRQSDRSDLYQAAFDRLHGMGAVYPCGCTRREIEEAASAPGGPNAAGVYPGTCRDGLSAGRDARAWRMRAPAGVTIFDDRAAGVVRQDVASDVGDFVIRRADGLWAYQLAVVVDDADQGVTDIVRGADLLDSTPRQRLLQSALGLPHPRTLHVPLVMDASGVKLAKGHGALPLDRNDPLPALHEAARHLGIEVAVVTSIADFWERATVAWAARWLRDDPSPS